VQNGGQSEEEQTHDLWQNTKLDGQDYQDYATTKNQEPRTKNHWPLRRHNGAHRKQNEMDAIKRSTPDQRK